jgi:hypothetical protein
MPVNAGLLGVTITTFNAYHVSLKDKFPVDVVRAVEQRLTFWLTLAVNLLCMATSVAFLTGLLPMSVRLSLPPVGAVRASAEQVALVMTLVCGVQLGVVLTLKSPWGLARDDAGRISRLIVRRAGAEKYKLLAGLAHNRSVSGDLHGWTQALGCLERSIAEGLEMAPGSGVARMDAAVAQALEGLSAFDSSPRSAAFATSLIDSLERIADHCLVHGEEQWSIRITHRIMSLPASSALHDWHAMDRRHVRGVAFGALARIVDRSLRISRQAVPEAVLNGLRRATYHEESPDRAMFRETCLSVIPLCSLMWESALRTSMPVIGERIVAFIGDLGSLGLERDSPWLTALSIERLQEFAIVCVDLDDDLRLFWSVCLMKHLIAISRSGPAVHRATVDHVVTAACRRVCRDALPDDARGRFECAFELRQPADALLAVLGSVRTYAGAIAPRQSIGVQSGVLESSQP